MARTRSAARQRRVAVAGVGSIVVVAVATLLVAATPATSAAGPPTPPLLPAQSTLRVLHECLGNVTHVCPNGKTTSLAVTYYDGAKQLNRQDIMSASGGQDTQLFQAFQSVINASHLQWDVFMLPTAEAQGMMCFRSPTPGTFPAPDMLRSSKTTYAGTTTLKGATVNVWQTADVWTVGNTVQTFTDATSGAVAGQWMLGQGVMETVISSDDSVPDGFFDEPNMKCQ